MTTRILPPSEWPKLAGTEAETVWPQLDPSQAHVLVVEEAGVIVGCWTLFPVMHAECVWIAPSHQGQPSVVFRLLAGMKRLAVRLGAPQVMTAALSDDVRALVQRLGGIRVPGEAYMLPMLKEMS